MALETVTKGGHGGAGSQGDGASSFEKAIKELQGLTISLLAGAAANTKIALAAIRPEDTILKAFNNNAGTITDITGTMSIDSLKASGTVTVGSAVANDTVTIAGMAFTFVASKTNPLDYTKVVIGGTAEATAINLEAALKARLAQTANPTISVSRAVAVLTITAVAEGTAGNSITLAETGSSATISGATLAGGDAAGSVLSTGITNQIILFWFNKNP